MTNTTDPVTSSADPMPQWEDRVREIYAATPAHTPFTRKVIPYETARRHGLRSAFRAEQQASAELGIAVATISN